MPLDSYQSAVASLISTGNASAVIQARAGSGKTRTALEGQSGIKYGPTTRTGMIVFNRRNADEMTERATAAGLPVTNRPSLPGAYFATHHSFGNSLCYENGSKHRTENRKPAYTLANWFESQPRFKGKKPFADAEFWLCLPALELVESAMNEGILPDATAGEWLVSEAEGIVSDKTPEELGGIALAVLQLMMADARRLCFAEMLYLPYVRGWRLARPFPLLIADEAQDLTRVQRELCLRNAERIVAIGDDRQAIYGWRGADSDSMNSWNRELDCRSTAGYAAAFPDGFKPCPYAGTLPMPTNYRCGSDIIALAQRIVPDIVARPNAPTGDVRIDTDFYSDTSEANEALGEFWNRYRPTVGDSMVLCRNNAPLVRLFVETLRYNSAAHTRKLATRKNSPRSPGAKARSSAGSSSPDSSDTPPRAFYQGGTFPAELVKLYKQVSGGDYVRFPMMAEAFKASRIMAMQLAGKASQAESLLDKLECVEILHRASSNESDLAESFAHLGSDDARENAVVLSTVHRAKGLESENVYLIRPDLIPHSRSTTPEAKLQELNLAYVAVTRAKESLTVCGPLPPAFALAEALRNATPNAAPNSSAESTDKPAPSSPSSSSATQANRPKRRSKVRERDLPVNAE